MRETEAGEETVSKEKVLSLAVVTKKSPTTPTAAVVIKEKEKAELKGRMKRRRLSSIIPNLHPLVSRGIDNPNYFELLVCRCVDSPKGS